MALGFKRRECAALLMNRLRRNDNSFAFGEHSGTGSSFRIARAQMAFFHRLTGKQTFRVIRGQPFPVLRDADRDDIELIFINSLNNGSGREQRDLMFAASSAKEHAHTEFLHDLSVWTVRGERVNLRHGSGRTMYCTLLKFSETK